MYLLDTMVISEPTKVRRNAGAAAWLSRTDPAAMFISVVSVAEIAKGVGLLPSGPKQDSLADWMRSILPKAFHGRVLDVDWTVAERWGELESAAGRTLPAADTLIAATALAHGLVIVTRNVGDFAAFPVQVLNPYT